MSIGSTADAEIPVSQRDVLTAIFSSMNGLRWDNNTNWCAGTCPESGTFNFNARGTECSWYGITCNGSDVTEISFGGNNLYGTIPDLSGLPALTHVDFDGAGNQLGGSIPPIAGLTHLQYFDVGSNALTGNIPQISGLTELVWFAVHANKLTGNIPAMSNVPALQYFFCDGNDLVGALPVLSGAPNLVWFYAGYNQLSGNIPDFAGVSSLTQFDVASNQLSGFIPQLPPNLASFRASDNHLAGNISSLATAMALQSFVVSGNSLSGGMPDISGLSALRVLYIDHNQLTGSISTAPSNLIAAGSAICPNLFDTIPTAKDNAWNLATGYTPWWASPTPTNKCDEIFLDRFEGQ